MWLKGKKWSINKKREKKVDQAFKTHNSYLPKILKCMKTLFAWTLNEKKKWNIKLLFF